MGRKPGPIGRAWHKRRLIEKKLSYYAYYQRWARGANTETQREVESARIEIEAEHEEVKALRSTTAPGFNMQGQPSNWTIKNTEAK